MENFDQIIKESAPLEQLGKLMEEKSATTSVLHLHFHHHHHYHYHHPQHEETSERGTNSTTTTTTTVPSTHNQDSSQSILNDPSENPQHEKTTTITNVDLLELSDDEESEASYYEYASDDDDDDDSEYAADHGRTDPLSPGSEYVEVAENAPQPDGNIMLLQRKLQELRAEHEMLNKDIYNAEKELEKVKNECASLQAKIIMIKQEELIKNIEDNIIDISYRNCFNNMDSGVILINMRNGEPLFLNHAFERMFGYPAEEILHNPKWIEGMEVSDGRQLQTPVYINTNPETVLYNDPKNNRTHNGHRLLGAMLGLGATAARFLHRYRNRQGQVRLYLICWNVVMSEEEVPVLRPTQSQQQQQQQQGVPSDTTETTTTTQKQKKPLLLIIHAIPVDADYSVLDKFNINREDAFLWQSPCYNYAQKDNNTNYWP